MVHACTQTSPTSSLFCFDVNTPSATFVSFSITATALSTHNIFTSTNTDTISIIMTTPSTFTADPTSNTKASEPRRALSSPIPSYDSPKKHSALRKLVPRKLASPPPPPSYEEVCGGVFEYGPSQSPTDAQVGPPPSLGQGYGPMVTPFVKSKGNRTTSHTVVRREINWAGWQALLPGNKSGGGGHPKDKSKSYSWEAAALARP